MQQVSVERVGYSRSEYLSDVVVHILGLAVVLACVPVLIVLAAIDGNGMAPISASVLYGCCLIAMITCSAVYNVFPHPEWEWLLKRLDHSAIYLKIAGSVTAFALIAGQGFLLVTGLWLAAGFGIVLKLISPFKFRWLGLTLYLGMGWATSFFGWELFMALPNAVVWLIGISGLLYTVGVAFYLWERLPYHNTIWHAHVLVASVVLYAANVVAISA
ncbi:MAG: hemolysin III family protein [Boseongicola sp.]|nr:hemolysin III family protein [Boseongicola sp.]MDD9979494.1 hemolysin III family protein [Boseongicola sp.]